METHPRFVWGGNQMESKFIIGMLIVIAITIGIAAPAAAATNAQADGMVQDTMRALQSHGSISPAANVNIPSITYWLNGEKHVISSPGTDVTIHVPSLTFVLFQWKGIYNGPSGTYGYMLCFFNDGVFRKHAKILTPGKTTTMAVDDNLLPVLAGTIDVTFAVNGPASNPAGKVITLHVVTP
jgi:hypothetical protein